MKTMLTLAMAIAVSTLTATLRAEEEGIDLTGVKCPVSGKQAVEKGKVDYKGAAIYTCCTKCPKAFAATPEKFAIKANAQLVATKQAVQVGCPISGKKLDPKWQIEVNGMKIGFCCKVCCKKAAEAKGDEQLTLVFAKFDKAYTTQTKCPIAKKPINPVHFVETDDKKLYFCCGKCKAAHEKKNSK